MTLIRPMMHEINARECGVVPTDLYVNMSLAQCRRNTPLVAQYYETVLGYFASNGHIDATAYDITSSFIICNTLMQIKPKKFPQQARIFIDCANSRDKFPDRTDFSLNCLFLSSIYTISQRLAVQADSSQYYRARWSHSHSNRLKGIDTAELLRLSCRVAPWINTMQFIRATRGAKFDWRSEPSLVVALIDAMARDRIDLLPLLIATSPPGAHVDMYAMASDLLAQTLHSPAAEKSIIGQRHLSQLSRFEGTPLSIRHLCDDYDALQAHLRESGLSTAHLDEALALIAASSDSVPIPIAPSSSVWQDTRQVNLMVRLQSMRMRRRGPSSLLVVGDGDFSFSVAAAHALQQRDSEGKDLHDVRMTCSCLDSEEQLLKKYSTAAANAETLRSAQCNVLFGVDATRLGETLGEAAFDAIVFNFPYGDTAGAVGEWDTFWIAKGRHMHLLRDFFRCCRLHLVRGEAEGEERGGDAGGRVYVSLLLHQVVSWQLQRVAAAEGLVLSAMYPFDCAHFASLR